MVVRGRARGRGRDPDRAAAAISSYTAPTALLIPLAPAPALARVIAHMSLLPILVVAHPSTRAMPCSTAGDKMIITPHRRGIGSTFTACRGSHSCQMGVIGGAVMLVVVGMVRCVGGSLTCNT